MRLGKTTALYFGTQVVLSVAGFAATFVIARLLGSAALGTYSVVLALMFWGSIPGRAVASAVNKRVSEGSRPGEALGGGLALTAAVCLVVAVVVLVGHGFVDRYVGAPVAPLVAALLCGNIVFRTLTEALNGQKRVSLSGGVTALERLLRTGAQVAFILLGYRVGGLVAGHTAALVVTSVAAFALFTVRPTLPSRDALVDLLSYARYSWLGTLQTVSFGWIDTTILAFFVVHSDIGIYEASWTLGSALMLAGVSIRRTLFPELSELGANADYDRVRHFLDEGLSFVGIIGVPGAFGALVLGDRILRLYKPEFARGATVFTVLVVAQLVAAFGQQLLSATNAIDRPDAAFRVNAAFIATNVVLNVVLISQFGWTGAAVATLLAAVLMSALAYVALARTLGDVPLPVGEVGRQVVAAAVMAVCVYAARPWLPVGNYATVAAAGGGAVIYGGCLLALSARTRQKVLGLAHSL